MELTSNPWIDYKAPVQKFLKIPTFGAHCYKFALLIYFGAANLSARADLAPPPASPTPAKKSVELPAKKLVPADASASEADSETRIVLKAVSERYKKLSKWKASFTQETYSVGLGTGTFNEGLFVFSAPNKFRYSLISPEASDFISNGKSAWYAVFKKGRKEAASVRHFADLSKVELDRYLIVLRGLGATSPAQEKKIFSDFAVSGKTIQDELHLVLEPKKSSEITRITLIFKQSQTGLYRAILEDALNNKTTITINKYEAQKSIAAKVFEPEFPKGSTVEEL